MAIICRVYTCHREFGVIDLSFYWVVGHGGESEKEENVQNIVSKLYEEKVREKREMESTVLYRAAGEDFLDVETKERDPEALRE